MSKVARFFTMANRFGVAPIGPGLPNGRIRQHLDEDPAHGRTRLESHLGAVASPVPIREGTPGGRLVGLIVNGRVIGFSRLHDQRRLGAPAGASEADVVSIARTRK
jgi:hypothetical protein